MAKTLIHFIKFPSNIFFIVLLLVLVILISLDTTNGSTARFPLYHREKFIASHFNDERSLVLARLARDRARFKHLHRCHNWNFNSAQFVQPNIDNLYNETELFEEGGEFVTVLKVGTPPQKVQLLVDIGTPFTWWQCQPNCEYCYSTPHHIFDTSMSSTYTEIKCADGPCDVGQLYILGCVNQGDPKCHYKIQYVDGSVSQGVMGTDVVAAESLFPYDTFSFGCGRQNKGVTMFNAGATGVLGLVPGGYSFSTQFQTSNFSLSLPSYNTTAGGTLYLNYYPPIFQYSSRSYLNIRMDHYYLEFSGIEIEEGAVPIPPELWECDLKGVGGVIIDTGSTITRFPQKAYDIFKDYFLRGVDEDLIRLPGQDQLDTCFNVTGVEDWASDLPKVRFLFKHNLNLPLEFEADQLLMSVGNGKYCLAFGAGGPTSIFGSWQLQRTLIGFDLQNRVVGFHPGYNNFS